MKSLLDSSIKSSKVACLLAALCGLLVVSFVRLWTVVKAPMSSTLVYDVINEEQATSRATTSIDTAIADRLKSLREGKAKVRLVETGRFAVDITAPDAEKLAEAVTSVQRRLAFRTVDVEFRILADRRDPQIPSIDVRKDPTAKRLVGEGGELLAWWVPLAWGVDPKPFQESQHLFVRPGRSEENGTTEILVVNDPFSLTGRYLPFARPGIDVKGNPTVDLSFDEDGGQLLGKLTSANLPDNRTGFRRRLGMLIDGKLCVAPEIQGRLANTVQITGLSTQSEVEDICSVLNSQTRPLALRRVSLCAPGDDPQGVR